MATNADNVRVAVTGAVRTAPVGTTAPTNSTSSFATGWVDLGYISDAGITESQNQEWTEITAWQNRDIVRRALTSTENTWQFTVIETTQTALELYHAGSSVDGTGAGTYKLEVVAPTDDVRAFGIDVIDGSIHTRIIVPKGVVSERGDIVYDGETPIGYELTIAARASGVLDGNGSMIYAYKYSDDPGWGSLSSS